MKKLLLIISALIVIGILASLFFLRSSSGYRSIYFVPKDAIVIIEAKDPVKTWDKIVHSKAWNHFSGNAFFSELNNDISSYDSLVNSNKFLLKLMGKKSVTLSQHSIGNGKYEYIYIVDIGRIGKSKSLDKLVNSVLGKGYEVTSRAYKDSEIIELFDIEESTNYFMSFTKGKLIFSFEPKLVEKAIDACEHKHIGRDMKFLDVQSRIGNKGIFSVYFSYKNIKPIISSLSPESIKTYQHNSRYFCYTGLLFDIDEEGLISMEGYTSMNDSSPDEYLGMLTTENIDVYSANVIPLRIASMAKLNMNNAQSFFEKTMKSMDQNDYDEYMLNVASLEKKLKIKLDENLFSWMDKEIVMLQTQPSNLGRDNEFAVIFHATDSAKAAENLNFIWRQIKKNTPVKIKSVNYKGYPIDYVAFPGIAQALFGKTLDKIEKPYFTIIENNVVISNHPQTIKNIIDDYLKEESLKTSLDYYNFIKHFSNKSSAFIYFEPPVLFQNLKGFVDAKTWQKVKQNKKYITCFSQGGFQINKIDNILHFVLKAQYKPETVEWKKQRYNSSEIFSMFSYSESNNNIQDERIVADTLPIIIIQNLDAKKQEEFYENGNVKLEVELKNGLKHGTIKQYHENGELYLKGEYDNDEPISKWKYYNEEGKLIKKDNY